MENEVVLRLRLDVLVPSAIKPTKATRLMNLSRKIDQPMEEIKKDE